MALALPTSLSALSRREWRLLALGGASLLAFCAYLAWPAAAPEPVLLAEPDPAAPAPAGIPAAAEPVTPTPAPASLEGLALRGVMGGGQSGGAAILLMPGGGERIVRVGREFLPGLRLAAIGVSHAIIARADGEVRLDLGRAGATRVESAAAEPQPAGLGIAPDLKRETMQYRLGLAPVKSGGFQIKPGADLPRLRAAGLQPGDVLLAVNGQELQSEEKVLELAHEIATAYTAEFEFWRGGKRMKASMEVNRRP